MPERGQLRFLLDEHYPGWLAEDLAADGIEAVALTAHRPALRGVDDQRVLQAAVAEHRIVVTEDVSTFGAPP
jgi:predicted nuclease of predicted toxin-antitoxin system